jgi:hypothetical protein
MERLWSLAGATGGDRSQIRSTQKPQKQANTVAVGCDQLPRGVHGKEGVDPYAPLLPMARNWRAYGDLQLFYRGSRLPEPALSPRMAQF